MNLLYTYAELIDAGDSTGRRAVAAGRTAARRAALRRPSSRASRGAQTYGFSTRLTTTDAEVEHVTTDAIIEVDEDAGTATSRACYTVLQATDDLPLQPIITGRYSDTFQRVDGEWCFDTRTL